MKLTLCRKAQQRRKVGANKTTVAAFIPKQ